MYDLIFNFSRKTLSNCSYSSGGFVLNCFVSSVLFSSNLKWKPNSISHMIFLHWRGTRKRKGGKHQLLIAFAVNGQTMALAHKELQQSCLNFQHRFHPSWLKHKNPEDFSLSTSNIGFYNKIPSYQKSYFIWCPFREMIQYCKHHLKQSRKQNSSKQLVL